MISVNLLPGEFIEKKMKLDFPIREIAVVIFLILLLVWFVFFQIGGVLHRKVVKSETQHKALAPKVAAAEKVLQEMKMIVQPKKSFVDILRKPQSQRDQILNLISDTLPAGVWLSGLGITDTPEFAVRIEGYSKPQENRSTIGLVGDFVAELKKQFESFILVGSEAAGSTAPRINAEMFTDQTEMAEIKVTHFIINLKEKMPEQPV